MTWTSCGTALCQRCSAGSGPVHAGSFLRSFTWATCGSSMPWPAVPERPGSGHAAAARRRRAGVHRHGLDAKTRVRARQAGRRVRAHENPGQELDDPRPERPGRGDLHAAGRAGDRGHPAARRQSELRRGAASLAAEAISTARQAGCTGKIVFRIDSAYYSAAVLGAIRRGGACFSVTVRMDPKIRAAIAAIGQDAWTPITYPRAIWDEDQQR